MARCILVFMLIFITTLLLTSESYISSTNVSRMYFNKSHIQQLLVNPVHLLEVFQLSEFKTRIFTYNIVVSGVSV